VIFKILVMTNGRRMADGKERNIDHIGGVVDVGMMVIGEVPVIVSGGVGDDDDEVEGVA
jgi:hypothetical protein